MRKRFFIYAVVLAVFFSFSCGESKRKVRLGILPVIDALPLVIADSEGFFRKEGIDVELVMFNSALERDAAYTAGSIDGMFGDLISFFLMIKNGIDTRLVTESYHTSPQSIMFALLASPLSQIKTVDGIKDEPVAVSRGTIIEFFLDQIVVSKHFSPEKINKIEVKAIPVRYQMLISGSVRLALLPEPLVSKAVKDGARLIADDTGLNTTATVVMFKGDFLDKNRSDFIKFISAYNGSVKAINQSPERFKSIMISKLRLPGDIRESYKTPRFNEAVLPSRRDVMLVYEWMKKNRMITSSFDYQKLIFKIEKK